MTYRELVEKLSTMTIEQLGQTVTVEMALEEECHPAELRVTGEDHFLGEDQGHLVLYVK